MVFYFSPQMQAAWNTLIGWAAATVGSSQLGVKGIYFAWVYANYLSLGKTFSSGDF